jgi:hypothetical protein
MSHRDTGAVVVRARCRRHLGRDQVAARGWLLHQESCRTSNQMTCQTGAEATSPAVWSLLLSA